jgi:hypothetical protein
MCTSSETACASKSIRQIGGKRNAREIFAVASVGIHDA